MKTMRRTSLTIVLLLILAVGSVSAASIPEHSGRLQVTGNAVVTAAPDTATIILGVETSSASADNAAAENADRMQSVLEALAALGLESSAISTSGYNIYSYSDTYARTTPEETVRTTYHVQNRITVTTKELDQVGRIVDVAVKTGANQVQNVSFDLADKQDLQLQALEVAIQQALTKAEVMAKSAGEVLGGIVSIDEEYGTYAPRNESLKMMAVGFDQAAETSINPGEIEVTAQVTIEFWF